MSDSTKPDPSKSEPSESQALEKTSDQAGEPAPTGQAESVDKASADAPNTVTQEPGAESISQGRTNRTMGWVLAGAWLILLGVVGIAGYTGWQQLETVKTAVAAQEVEVSAKAGKIQALEESLSAALQSERQMASQLQAAMESLQQKTQDLLKQHNTTLTQMGARLDGQQKRINTLSTTSREDWLLAEAEYLMRLANQRVLLERSPQNATALLSTADRIIKEVADGLGDSELFAIRQSLGREMTALKLVADVDTEGTYLQLGALADAVSKLPRLASHGLRDADRVDVMPVPDSETDGQSVWNMFKDSLGFLDQYVRITEFNGDITPVLSDAEAELVVANVQLLIQQAQLALLKEEPELYALSLQTLTQTVTQRFAPSPAREQFLAEVARFQAVSIAPELPDISNSLKLLNAYIKKLHKLGGQSIS